MIYHVALHKLMQFSEAQANAKKDNRVTLYNFALYMLWGKTLNIIRYKSEITPKATTTDFNPNNTVLL